MTRGCAWTMVVCLLVLGPMLVCMAVAAGPRQLVRVVLVVAAALSAICAGVHLVREHLVRTDRARLVANLCCVPLPAALLLALLTLRVIVRWPLGLAYASLGLTLVVFLFGCGIRQGLTGLKPDPNVPR